MTNFLSYEIFKFNNRFRSFNPENNIIISAYPRGGSTWLENILSNIIKRSITYYEPLNLATNQDLKDFKFSWRQFIPENESWPEVKDYFSNMFMGKNLKRYLIQHPNSTPRKFLDFIFPKTIIYKFCRLNLMLPWIVKNFQIKPPVLLVRHPCAIIASQIEFGRRFGRGYADIGNKFTYPECPYSDFYYNYSSILDKVDNPVKNLAAWWCLSHIVPLKHEENNKKWTTVFFEDLLTDPNECLQIITKSLRLNESTELALKKYHLPSRTSINNNNKIDPSVQLKKWKVSLSKSEINDILRILDQFELSNYYNDSVLPLIS
jgi:hypothetical protein